MHRIAVVLAGLVYVSIPAFADTLTFVAQMDATLGSTNHSWFYPENWFTTDDENKLIPAGRVPLANETVIITGAVDVGTTGVRMRTLVLTNSAAVTNGTLSVEQLEMWNRSAFHDTTLNVLTRLDIKGTNCLLNGAAVTILGTAAGTLKPAPPASAATLDLSEGAIMMISGSLFLSDGSRITAVSGLSNRLAISGLLSSTNLAKVLAAPGSGLIVDNSGVIRAYTGTLAFDGAIEWRSTAGVAQFEAASTNALLLFASTLQVPAESASYFTGPGVSQLQAGATIQGSARVGRIAPDLAVGKMIIDDSVSGTGDLQVLGNLSSGSDLTWNNGTMSLPAITIDFGATMEIPGPSQARRTLSACAINNSGVCWVSNAVVSLEHGAAINNQPYATLELQAEATFSGTPLPNGGAVNNMGILLKSGNEAAQFGTMASAQGPDFNNTSHLDIRAGTLHVFGGVSSGEFHTETNALLSFWGGTHVLTGGTTFTGDGLARVAQGAAPAKWSVTGPITAERLEVGLNGLVAGFTNSVLGTNTIGLLTLQQNGILADGGFLIRDLRLRDEAEMTNSTASVASEARVSGTNCTLRGSSLTIEKTASCVFDPREPGVSTTLKLREGSTLAIAGKLNLAERSLISGGGLPRSRVWIKPDALLNSTNNAYIRGASVDPLIIVNSGLIQVAEGTLTFENGIDWQSGNGIVRFHTTATNSQLAFASRLQVPSMVTCSVTGLGVTRLLSGATIQGLLQAWLPLELLDNLDGPGTLRMLRNPERPAALRWKGNVLSGVTIIIDEGAEMWIDDEGIPNRRLSGCVINNSGLCIWPGQPFRAGSGAVINVFQPGSFEIRGDGALEFDGTMPQLVINNAGRLAKIAGTGSTVVSADVNNSGTLRIQSGAFEARGALVQTEGTTLIPQGTVLIGNLFDIRGGAVTGAGSLQTRVQNGGSIAPDPVLTLTTGKDFQQTPKGRLSVRLGGTTPGTQHDQLNVIGNAQLDGELTLQLANGFSPKLGESFAVLTSGSLSGTFAKLDGPTPPNTAWMAKYTTTNVTLFLTRRADIGLPTLTAGAFSFQFPTTPGLVYLVQASPELGLSRWETIQVLNGDGAIKTVVEPATSPRRFYRVLIE